MSNRERISWVALMVNLTAGGSYFANILLLPASADLFDSRVAHMSVWVVFLVIIASEVLSRIVQKRAGGGGDAADIDERDTAIQLRAHRNAHYVLGGALVAVIIRIVLIKGEPDSTLHNAESVLDVLMKEPLAVMHVVQLLVAALCLSAVAFNLSRIFFYRRGY